MRSATIHHVLGLAAFIIACAAGSLQAGEVRAWGLNRDGQVTEIPAGSDYVAVAAGDAHGLALRSDGAVVAWGRNEDGQCEVPPGTYQAIGAGADFSLAIRTDGSIAAWGYDGQRQISGVPAGNDFVAVDGGELFAVALRADGSLVAWGNNRWGQVSDVPVGKGFKAVAAGDDHAVALQSDGSLVSWGYWTAPEGAPTSGVFTAVGAGGSFSVALKDDGSIVWWGSDPYGNGLSRVPTGNDCLAVSAGYLHGLALKRDGSVVGWGAGTDASGYPNWGQAMPPAGNDYKALACGLYFSVALTGEIDPVDPPKPPDPPEPPEPPKPDPAVVADNFDDNLVGSLWRLYGEDLVSCWLEEANQRMELMASAQARGISAYCMGSDWRLDPMGDFSFKVDYHYAPVTDQAGWVFLGIAPDANDVYMRYVKVGAGCDKQHPYLWYETIDGERNETNFIDRRQDDGVLYVSYDAAKDELYLSGAAYGSESAWTVIPGLLQGSWRGAPVTVFLGGGANGLDIVSGDAWLDNFAVDMGSVLRPSAASISEVHRFWSPVLARHFYTIDSAEKDMLIREFANFWTYEGPVYKAATTPFQAGLAPVYRFWSPTGQSHFYTIDEAEKNQLIEKYPDVWTFEGIAFYAYPEGAQPAETMPVFRFWKLSDNSHFYTMDPSERDMLIKEYPHIYSYEGVAFYAYRL